MSYLELPGWAVVQSSPQLLPALLVALYVLVPLLTTLAGQPPAQHLPPVPITLLPRAPRVLAKCQLVFVAFA